MTLTVSARGQMVIPASLRKKYSIKPNTKIELLDLGQEIVIVPLSGRSLKQSRGILKGVSTGDLVKERRQARKQEHRYRG